MGGSEQGETDDTYLPLGLRIHAAAWQISIAIEGRNFSKICPNFHAMCSAAVAGVYCFHIAGNVLSV